MIRSFFLLTALPLILVNGFTAPFHSTSTNKNQIRNNDAIRIQQSSNSNHHEKSKSHSAAAFVHWKAGGQASGSSGRARTQKKSSSSVRGRLNYRNSDDESSEFNDGVAVSVDLDTLYRRSKHDVFDKNEIEMPVLDPAKVEFVPAEDKLADDTLTLEEAQSKVGSLYPFAAMMQGSAVYIAFHAGKTAVFHIPGDLIEDGATANHLLSDIALCWLLGMKIVIVVGTREIADHNVYSSDDEDDDDEYDKMEAPHEVHNSLKATDIDTLRKVEEDAGFLRTEVERRLNKFLRAHGASTGTSDSPLAEGNVVSGNFYTAQSFGIVRGEDYEYTGYTTSVHNENIRRVLNNNDVVLLSTVGMSAYGELVNVNGYHLAAAVAASLEASKCIYVANEGSMVLRKAGEDISIQELPLSFSKSITDYHQVKCHNTGFATFERARQSLDPAAVELLLHLGWSNWALDHGVDRAHIVNPKEGSLLEELFTSKNGANTCLFHDEDGVNHQRESEKNVAQQDWDDFFAAGR